MVDNAVSLASLAHKAKRRLKAEHWVNQKAKTEAQNEKCRKYGITISACQYVEDIDGLYDIVQKMLSSNQIIINPVAHLIDNALYNRLSIIEKELYSAKLMECYRCMRSYYYEKLLAQD